LGRSVRRKLTSPKDLQEGTMAGFTQIIEMQTSRIDEVEALIRELRNRLDDGQSTAPRRATMTADRDREGFYVSIVEFDSYEAAMENSNRPEVNEYAGRLAKLCDAPPKFYNLDVRETWQPHER
jgi:chromosome segregation ATPase